VSEAPKSAWGDEVGPRAAADVPPETRFPARRRRVAAGECLAEHRRTDKVELEHIAELRDDVALGRHLRACVPSAALYVRLESARPSYAR
jgi:hypothetical protein